MSLKKLVSVASNRNAEKQGFNKSGSRKEIVRDVKWKEPSLKVGWP